MYAITCYTACLESLKTNPDREYTPKQMQDHIRKNFKIYHNVHFVSQTLKKIHDDGAAERIRNGGEAFRYSLANTN